MSPFLEVHEAPLELEDALARIHQAQDNYASLAKKLDEFLCEYIGGMVKGLDSRTGSFVLQLRHPNDSNVAGSPRVLVASIVEDLRSALDYMVFQLSVSNDSDLDERVPQFVIARNKAGFDRQAKRRLQYLTDDQRRFVEQVQPYHGRRVLSVLGEIAGASKHRRLLSVRDATSLDISMAEITKIDEFPGHVVYPMEKGMAIFARAKDGQSVVLMDRYDAMLMLKSMIECTMDIVGASYGFFQEHPVA